MAVWAGLRVAMEAAVALRDVQQRAVAVERHGGRAVAARDVGFETVQVWGMAMSTKGK
jgi:hypothetical protein